MKAIRQGDVMLVPAKVPAFHLLQCYGVESRTAEKRGYWGKFSVATPFEAATWPLEDPVPSSSICFFMTETEDSAKRTIKDAYIH